MTIAPGLARHARWFNLAGFAATAGMMAYALYAEYALYLMPCHLCVLQRIATVALGFVFLAAAVHNPRGGMARLYALLIAATAGAGAAVAGWQLRLQYLPHEDVATCGPGFDRVFETLPLGEALRVVFSGSGDCSNIDWLFLGLSMPAWVLIALLLLLAGGVGVNLSRARHAS